MLGIAAEVRNHAARFGAFPLDKQPQGATIVS